MYIMSRYNSNIADMGLNDSDSEDDSYHKPVKDQTTKEERINLAKVLARDKSDFEQRLRNMNFSESEIQELSYKYFYEPIRTGGTRRRRTKRSRKSRRKTRRSRRSRRR